MSHEKKKLTTNAGAPVPDNQNVLFENTARALGGVSREVKIRHIGHCAKADPAYGEGVAQALGMPMSEVPDA